MITVIGALEQEWNNSNGVVARHGLQRLGGQLLFHTTWDHFWGVIELTVLCAFFVSRVGYFDAQIREALLYTSRGFDLLASLGKCN